jgi:hypothetical protein
MKVYKKIPTWFKKYQESKIRQGCLQCEFYYYKRGGRKYGYRSYHYFPCHNRKRNYWSNFGV